MTMQLNVFIIYLSNINCTYLVKFDYYYNIFKKMRYLNN